MLVSWVGAEHLFLPLPQRHAVAFCLDQDTDCDLRLPPAFLFTWKIRGDTVSSRVMDSLHRLEKWPHLFLCKLPSLSFAATADASISRVRTLDSMLVLQPGTEKKRTNDNKMPGVKWKCTSCLLNIPLPARNTPRNKSTRWSLFPGTTCLTEGEQVCVALRLRDVLLLGSLGT